MAKAQKKIHKKPTIMVCVTRQMNCERLIKSGASLAKRADYNLLVVNVIQETQNIMENEDQSLALELLFKATTQYGGQMTVVRAKDTIEALCLCATQNDVGIIIMGESPKTNASSLSIIDQLKQRIPKTSFVIVESKTPLSSPIKIEQTKSEFLKTVQA